MHRLVAAIAIIAALALAADAHAQSPTPGGSATPGITPVPTRGPSMFPYRIMLTGPHRVLLDQPITFTLDYTRVVAPGPGDIGGGFVLDYEFPAGMKLVSVTAEHGAAPTDLGPQLPSAENFELSGTSGEWAVVLQPPPGYIGEVSVSFYVRGTEISLPEGTVASATTPVAPEGSMIITGEVPVGAGTQVTVDVLDPRTAQTVKCPPSLVQSTPVLTSPGVALPDVSAFSVIVPPSCVDKLSDNLRLCWSFPQACITLLFTAGEHDIGLLPRITVVSPPPAAGPVSPPGGALVGPDTGSGMPAAHADRTTLAVALALAAMAGVVLAGGVVLRRR